MIFQVNYMHLLFLQILISVKRSIIITVFVVRDLIIINASISTLGTIHISLILSISFLPSIKDGEGWNNKIKNVFFRNKTICDVTLLLCCSEDLYLLTNELFLGKEKHMKAYKNKRSKIRYKVQPALTAFDVFLSAIMFLLSNTSCSSYRINIYSNLVDPCLLFVCTRVYSFWIRVTSNQFIRNKNLF